MAAKAPKPTRRDRAQITFHVEPELKEAWSEYCERNCLSASRVLRNHVADVLGGRTLAPGLQSELSALAEKHGMAFRDVLVWVLRRGLGDTPDG